MYIYINNKSRDRIHLIYARYIYISSPNSLTCMHNSTYIGRRFIISRLIVIRFSIFQAK